MTLTLCTYVHAHVTDDALGLRCLQQLCKNLESMKESITLKKVVCTAISPVREGGRERKGGRRVSRKWVWLNNLGSLRDLKLRTKTIQGTLLLCLPDTLQGEKRYGISVEGFC